MQPDARETLIAAARRGDAGALDVLIRALPARLPASATTTARNARLAAHHRWLLDRLPAEMHQHATRILHEIGAALAEHREPTGAGVALLSDRELHELTTAVAETLALMPQRRRGRWLTLRQLQNLF